METNNYGLYQTLNVKISKKNLKVKEKKELLSRLSDLDNDSREAVLMLICEHAKFADDFIYNPDDFSLPYSGNQVKGNVTFDLEKLPNPLCWILLKFTNVISKNDQEE